MEIPVDGTDGPRRRKSRFDVGPADVSHASIVHASIPSASVVRSMVDPAHNDVEVEIEPPRRRKSRFDVGPADASNPNTDFSSAIPTAIIEDVYNNDPPKRRKSRFDIAPEALSPPSFDADSFLASILPASLPSAQEPWIVFTEPFFSERLNKAMEKNLAYIERKDALAAAGVTMSTPKIIVNPIANVPKRNVNEAKPGLGTASAPVTKPYPAHQETSSVYVTGFPLDITKEELEILFGSVGKLRRVKLYTNEQGAAKGDALVSYTKPDMIYFAIQKYHGCDIGDGYVLSVTKAKFTPKTHEISAAEILQLRETLPEKCNNANYPVALLRNIFDGNMIGDDVFVDDLKNDIYTECCKFGPVVAVVSLTTPTLVGSIAITFAAEDAAIACRNALDQRKFDGRVVSAVVIPSAPPAEPIPGPVLTEDKLEGDLAKIEEVEQDTEDFLNSLL